MAAVKIAHNIARPVIVAPPRPPNSVLCLNGFAPQTDGTAGVLTLNDCTSLEEACAANEILSIPYRFANKCVGGNTYLALENGLVVSEIPTDMVLSILYSVRVNRMTESAEPRRLTASDESCVYRQHPCWQLMLLGAVMTRWDAMPLAKDAAA